MITILAFITRWKWVLIGSGLVLTFLAGYHAKTIIYEARESKELQAEIVAHQAEEKRAFEHSAALEKELADSRKQNAQQAEDAKNEVKTVIYHSCVIPATGRVLYRKALTRLAAS